MQTVALLQWIQDMEAFLCSDEKKTITDLDSLRAQMLESQVTYILKLQSLHTASFYATLQFTSWFLVICHFCST